MPRCIGESGEVGKAGADAGAATPVGAEADAAAGSTAGGRSGAGKVQDSSATATRITAPKIATSRNATDITVAGTAGSGRDEKQQAVRVNERTVDNTCG